MNKLFLLLGITTTLFGCGSSAPKVVDDAKLKLWTAYNENIYTAKCQPKQSDEWFVICEKGTNKAVYWIQPLTETNYVIYAVNGKAKQHAEKMASLNISDFYSDGSHPNAEAAWDKLSSTL